MASNTTKALKGNEIASYWIGVGVLGSGHGGFKDRDIAPVRQESLGKFQVLLLEITASRPAPDGLPAGMALRHTDEKRQTTARLLHAKGRRLGMKNIEKLWLTAAPRARLSV